MSQQEDCVGLCAEYKHKYEALLAQQNEFGKELKVLETRFFADGYGDKEEMGE
jgi:hypothetical protein